MNKKRVTGESEKAKKIIAEHKGIIRSSQIRELGIHPRALYRLRDSGELLQLSRGVFCLNDYDTTGNLDLEIVSMRIPKAVICLVSALSYHKLTTQIPHNISIAIPKGMKSPIMDFPPLEVYHFSEIPYEKGIEYHTSNNAKIAVYDREKTIADCFKFRNSIGIDVVIEALKIYRQQDKPDFNKLIEYGRICRVEKIMTPYLEMLS
ncbi:MAG: type IV toxin-antitoxin system AbiEi family antitoxin domain-containing protein [Spirochaetia bacterium]|nr:type IV toxin-antitoxin system AbiEi family antitoxin domain-containing protein [Spirochaetia bacterium]MCF7940307.1 type IV toxin-antitoxin system AbiEi family antitoxin domain-containing protein [Spirochaetia bacterium]